MGGIFWRRVGSSLLILAKKVVRRNCEPEQAGCVQENVLTVEQRFWPSLFPRSCGRRLWRVRGATVGTRFTFFKPYWLCTRRGGLDENWEAGYQLPWLELGLAWGCLWLLGARRGGRGIGISPGVPEETGWWGSRKWVLLPICACSFSFLLAFQLCRLEFPRGTGR